MILSTFVVLFTLLGFFFFESGFFLSLKNSRFACSSSSSSSSGRARFPGCPTSSFSFPRQAPLLTSACNRGDSSSTSDSRLAVVLLALPPKEELGLGTGVVGVWDVPASMMYLGFTESLVPQISSRASNSGNDLMP